MMSDVDNSTRRPEQDPRESGVGFLFVGLEFILLGLYLATSILTGPWAPGSLIFFLAFLGVGLMVVRRVRSSRTVARPSTPLQVMGAVIFVITFYLGLRGVGESRESTWFVPGLTAAWGGVMLYDGMKRHTRERLRLWFGVYLLGFGIFLYWLPGGPYLQWSWLMMGMGGSFAIVGFFRLVRLHAT